MCFGTTPGGPRLERTEGTSYTRYAVTYQYTSAYTSAILNENKRHTHLDELRPRPVTLPASSADRSRRLLLLLGSRLGLCLPRAAGDLDLDLDLNRDRELDLNLNLDRDLELDRDLDLNLDLDPDLDRDLEGEEYDGDDRRRWWWWLCRWGDKLPSVRLRGCLGAAEPVAAVADDEDLR